MQQFFLTLILALGIGAVGPAQAQSYPARPITLVVPFAAGSGTDAVARIVAARLSERLGQAVIVDNRAGANAQIAALYVAKAAPDGYTLMMATNTSHSANPALFADLKYDPIRDFTPITRLGELPFALLVHPADPARNLHEWLEEVRQHPGAMSYATPNSTSLVASETIRRIEGLQLTGVPYRSSPQALTDLMSGQVQMYVADLGSALPMIRAGRVRALAVTTRQPVASLPGIAPVAADVQGFDLTSWNGVFGPAGVAADKVRRIDQELQAVLSQRDVKDKLAQIGFEIWPSRNPEEFTRYVADQLALWGRLIRLAGITPQ